MLSSVPEYVCGRAAGGARRVLLGVALGLIPLALTPALPAAAAGGLSVGMSESSTSVNSGGNLTYTIRLTNTPSGYTLVCVQGGLKPNCHEVPDGPTVSGITVTDNLPAGVVFTSVSASAGFVCGANGQTVACSNGSLAANQTGTITIAATAPTLPAGGANVVLTNTATVNPGALTTSIQTTVVAPPPPPVFVRASVSCNPSTGIVPLVSLVRCTASMFNASSIPLNNVETWLVTPLPVRVNNIQASNGFACTSSIQPAKFLDCTGGTLAPQSTATITPTFIYEFDSTITCIGVSALVDPNDQLGPLADATTSVCLT